MISPWHYRLASKIIHRGGIIAYPTEAVYGLGCDPLNYHAVEKICQLKNRSLDQGLILIAANVEQVQPYTDCTHAQLNKLTTKKNAQLTWLVPANPHCPGWVTGQHDSIAIRFTNHPIAKKLCKYTKHALISTSANRSGQEPARNALRVKQIFTNELDWILHAEVGAHSRPTEIRDYNSGDIIRQG